MSKNFTVRDLPKSERPRERLIKLGPEALSAQELLALIIARGIPGKSVMNIAQELLSKFGNIKCVGEATIEQLCQIKGIGSAKATQIMACFEISRRKEMHDAEQGNSRKFVLDSPESIAKLSRPILKDKKKEYLIVLPLDSRHQIMREEIVSIGSLNSNISHPREIFKQAIQNHAASIVIVHNHPSGNPVPSKEDYTLTEQMVEAGNILGIEIFDHVIIGELNVFSFKKSKVIKA